MPTPLKIVSVSSEVHPFSKTGGLADVARSLPKALKRLGHQVSVITPFYRQIIDYQQHNLKLLLQTLPVTVNGQKTVNFSIHQGYLMDDLPVYFIGNDKYFSKRDRLYGSQHENLRFFLFNLATLELLKKLGQPVDIIQCHDWHTGLIPYLLKRNYANDPFFSQTATIFTIHNLTFQLGHNWWEIPADKKDKGNTSLPPLDSPDLEYINFTKRGIQNADIINTVSESYAQEALTAKFGQDLHRILKLRRHRFFGIINGIDYFDYNPKTDPGLYRNYDYDSLYLKTQNKLYLQKKFSLPAKPKVPLIAIISRLSEQKGFDLLREIKEPLLRLNLQLIVWGGGDKEYINFFKKLSKNNKRKVATQLIFESKTVTQVYAASDMFLMPSRFEPCGLGQLISLRYGSVPIVHSTGGLADTITDFNPQTGRGNGFVFHTYDPRDLLVAITRAVQEHKHRDSWLKLVREAMQLSYSWTIPAKKYVTLFRKALLYKNKRNNNKN